MNFETAVKSAGRVLDVLELLARTSGQVRSTDISEGLGIPKSSTHMLLATLVSRGYVVSGPDRRFALHPSFDAGEASWIGGQLAGLLRSARPAARRLVAASGETALLAVMREQKLEYIEKNVSSQEVRCDVPLGALRPLHSTSPGLVLLAHLPDQKLDQYLASAPLERFTEHTLCDVRRLRQELAAIRKRGYCAASDTNSRGASGIAAPIRDFNGNVIAALSIACPTARFEAIRGLATSEVVREARAISDALSGMFPLQPPRTEISAKPDKPDRKARRRK